MFQPSQPQTITRAIDPTTAMVCQNVPSLHVILYILDDLSNPDLVSKLHDRRCGLQGQQMAAQQASSAPVPPRCKLHLYGL